MSGVRLEDRAVGPPAARPPLAAAELPIRLRRQCDLGRLHGGCPLAQRGPDGYLGESGPERVSGGQIALSVAHLDCIWQAWARGLQSAARAGASSCFYGEAPWSSSIIDGTLSDVSPRPSRSGTKRKDAALTGILLARPEDAVARELVLPNLEYWHYRSDYYTDFFCAGYVPLNVVRDAQPVRGDYWRAPSRVCVIGVH